MRSVVDIPKIRPGIEILMGIAVGTAIATFILWFLMGGGVLLHPIMAIFVYILVGIVCFLAAGAYLGYKGALVVLLSFFFGWYGFKHIYKVTCGPNPKDIKVMQPMANAISNYIVKHGIPKSLSEIPNLPYRLEGCKRGVGNGYTLENCSFKANGRPIKVDFRMDDHTIDRVNHKKIVMTMRNEKSETGVHVYLKNINNTSFVLQGMGFYSGRTDGICNPMRQ